METGEGILRLFAIGLAMLCAGCAPAPAPVEKPKPDITKEAWYAATSADLAALNTKARSYLQQGKKDEAAALIVKGQPLAERLLAASRPTLAAMEAASDLDQMYAEMLLSNRNFGWARLGFQKNVSRWKNWRPRTEDTARRLEQALAGMRECDRRIAE
jgi:hypothetical protein